MLKKSAQDRQKYPLVKIKFQFSSLILLFIISKFTYTIHEHINIIPSESLSFFPVLIISNLFVLLSIIIHEYAHVISGAYFGVKTERIVIFALGARAEMEELPNQPIPNLFISLAGPATSLLLSLFFYIGYVFINVGPIMPFFLILVYFNIVFGLFNLCLPIYPADGGRILHSIIWLFCSNRMTAMKICLIIGPMFYLAMLMFVGFHILFLAVFAVLSYFGWREYRYYSSPF